MNALLVHEGKEVDVNHQRHLKYLGMGLRHSSAVGHALCSTVGPRLPALVKTSAGDSSAHTTYPVKDHCTMNIP